MIEFSNNSEFYLRSSKSLKFLNSQSTNSKIKWAAATKHHSWISWFKLPKVGRTSTPPKLHELHWAIWERATARLLRPGFVFLVRFPSCFVIPWSKKSDLKNGIILHLGFVVPLHFHLTLLVLTIPWQFRCKKVTAARIDGSNLRTRSRWSTCRSYAASLHQGGRKKSPIRQTLPALLVASLTCVLLIMAYSTCQLWATLPFPGAWCWGRTFPN